MRNSTFGSGPRAALLKSGTYGGKIREVVKDQSKTEPLDRVQGEGGAGGNSRGQDAERHWRAV